MDCSDFLLWFPFVLGWLLNIVGLSISSPHKLPTLFWISAFAPIIVPVWIFSLILLIAWLIDKMERLGILRRTNQNAITTVAELGDVLPTEPRESPNTGGSLSFIATLPTYVYDKEMVDNGPICAICKEVLQKKDMMLQLPICLHAYHKECISLWLQSNMTCPVCRCRADMEIPRDIALIID